MHEYGLTVNHHHKQGCPKQSPDGQAQLDVGGEVVNNLRAKRAAKIWTLVFLAVRRCCNCTSASNWDSKAWKFSHTERKSYACALRYVPCRILIQQFETSYTNVEHVIMSQLRLRMVRPWPDQPDRFRRLWQRNLEWDCAVVYPKPYKVMVQCWYLCISGQFQHCTITIATVLSL